MEKYRRNTRNIFKRGPIFPNTRTSHLHTHTAPHHTIPNQTTPHHTIPQSTTHHTHTMFTEKGIFPIGDGLLDIDDDRLKGLLVSHDINEIYEVEQTPFAR